jgi:hypothetical protein
MYFEADTPTASYSIEGTESSFMRSDLKTICLLLMVSAGQLVPAGQMPTLACLSGFCVGDVHATESAVVKKLGAGIRTHWPDDVGESRCYVDATSGVWADFTFAGKEESSEKGKLRSIMLTEQQLCERQKGGHQINLGRQLAGASVGMSESEVLSSLGQPTRIDDAKDRETLRPSIAETRYSAKFGERVYVYDSPDDLAFTFVFFKNGRVRTIWFSSSE